MTTRRPLAKTVASLVALAVGLVGCGASSHKAATGSVKPAAASQPTLLVYSAQGYAPNAVEAFSKETHIPAKLVEDSTGPLLARIQAERASPQWGVLWIDGNEPFAALDREGELVKNLPLPDLTPLGQSLVAPDRSFLPTGVTLACAVAYDSAHLSVPPRTYQQLSEPPYAGKVGMNNPAVSGPTYPCVAGVMEALGGVKQGEAFFERLKGQGLRISETNGNTLHLLEAGQIEVALVQSSAAIGESEKVKGVKVAYLEKETVLPSVIGVDAAASPAVRAEAQRFVEWVYSPAGQHQMQIGDPHGDSLFWPVVNGEQPLPALPALAGISTQLLEPYLWGEREAAIDRWFSAKIAG